MTVGPSPCYIGTTSTVPSETGKGTDLKHSLGASLADGQLTLLCVHAAVARTEVVATLRVALPSGTEDEPALLQEIARFLIANRIPSGVRVTLGVPRADFLLRRFETPPVKPASLPELVGFEAERHLPGKREEFLCGWRVAGRLAGGGHAILLGAARKSGVERVAALLARANLAPASIQPEPFALAALIRRVVPALDQALVVDLGAAAVGIDALSAGVPVFSSTVPVEDPAWRESFAAAAANAGAGTPVEQWRTAAQQLGADLAVRLGSALFAESLPGGKLAEVLLVGPGSNRSQVLGTLQEKLRVPVRAVSPWPAVQWASPAPDLAAYTPALALALQQERGAQTLELAAERQEELHRAPSRRMTAALAILLAGVVVAQLASCGLRQQRELGRADQEIRVLKDRKEKVEAVHRGVKEQRARLDFLTTAMRGRAGQAQILRELTGLIPDNAYLSEYSFRERTVEITGLAPSASQLLPVLEASPLFAGVEFSAPIVAQGAGLERFRIRLRLESAGG